VAIPPPAAADAAAAAFLVAAAAEAAAAPPLPADAALAAAEAALPAAEAADAVALDPPANRQWNSMAAKTLQLLGCTLQQSIRQRLQHMYTLSACAVLCADVRLVLVLLCEVQFRACQFVTVAHHAPAAELAAAAEDAAPPGPQTIEVLF
jgi:hypothetical protein